MMYIKIKKFYKNFEIPIFFENKPFSAYDEVYLSLYELKCPEPVIIKNPINICNCCCPPPPPPPPPPICCCDNELNLVKNPIYKEKNINVSEKGYPVFPVTQEIINRKDNVYRCFLKINNKNYCCKKIYLKVNCC